jgi:hypothetical protein
VFDGFEQEGKAEPGTLEPGGSNQVRGILCFKMFDIKILSFYLSSR